MFEKRSEAGPVLPCRSRVPFTLCVLAAATVGCSTADKETYLHYVIEGQRYVLHDVHLGVTNLPDGRRFIELGDPFGYPSAVFQWRTEFASVDDLAGLELSFNDPELLMQFNLSEDVGVQPETGSSGSLLISTVAEGYVTGSFSGTNLLYVSMTGSSRRVDVTGVFRARVVQ